MRRIVLALLTAWLASSGAAGAEAVWSLHVAPDGDGSRTAQRTIFADGIGKATSGALRLALKADDGWKPSERKRHLLDGTIEAAILHLAHHAHDSGLFAVDQIPFVATTPEEAHRLQQAHRPFLARRLGEQGLVLLAVLPAPPEVLVALSPAPLESLKGVLMFAVTAAEVRVRELAAAKPADKASPAWVRLQASTAGEDGAKLYDLGYLIRVPFDAVVASEAALAKLPVATRKSVLAAAIEAETEAWRTFGRAIAGGGNPGAQSQKAVRIAPPDALKAELKAIGERMADEWATGAGADGAAIIKTYRAGG